MSATSASPSSAPPPAVRRAWMAVLARTPRADLEAALERALHDIPTPTYDWLRPPEIGLAMVRGRVGGSGDPFNLGEATVTRATLASARAGRRGRRGRRGVPSRPRPPPRRTGRASDALLQMPEHHAVLHRQLIEPFAAQLAAQRAGRQQDAAATRVEFFTMVRGD